MALSSRYEIMQAYPFVLADTLRWEDWRFIIELYDGEWDRSRRDEGLWGRDKVTDDTSTSFSAFSITAAWEGPFISAAEISIVGDGRNVNLPSTAGASASTNVYVRGEIIPWTAAGVTETVKTKYLKKNIFYIYSKYSKKDTIARNPMATKASH